LKTAAVALVANHFRAVRREDCSTERPRLVPIVWDRIRNERHF
jgi:hypothetical protein